MTTKSPKRINDELLIIRIVCFSAAAWLLVMIYLRSSPGEQYRNNMADQFKADNARELALLRHLASSGTSARTRLSDHFSLVLIYLLRKNHDLVKSELQACEHELNQPEFTAGERYEWHNKLASLYIGNGEIEKAIAIYDDELNAISKNAGPESELQVARLHNNRAVAHFLLAQKQKEKEQRNSEFEMPTYDFTDCLARIGPEQKAKSLPEKAKKERDRLNEIVKKNLQVYKNDILFRPMDERALAD